ncbi:hypothetical protein Btru_038692 [Bulinus truncatus]|nr:hypothetical protein Btru_038692 [Bulinus truncatus]
MERSPELKKKQSHRHWRGSSFNVRFSLRVYYTGLRVYYTGLRVYYTGLCVYYTGLRVYYTGLRVYYTGLHVYYTGLRVYYTGLRVYYTGLRVYYTGLRVYYTGLRVYYTGLRVYYTGLRVYYTGLRVYIQVCVSTIQSRMLYQLTSTTNVNMLCIFFLLWCARLIHPSYSKHTALSEYYPQCDESCSDDINCTSSPTPACVRGDNEVYNLNIPGEPFDVKLFLINDTEYNCINLSWNIPLDGSRQYLSGFLADFKIFGSNGVGEHYCFTLTLGANLATKLKSNSLKKGAKVFLHCIRMYQNITSKIDVTVYSLPFYNAAPKVARRFIDFSKNQRWTPKLDIVIDQMKTVHIKVLNPVDEAETYDFAIYSISEDKCIKQIILKRRTTTFYTHAPPTTPRSDFKESHENKGTTAGHRSLVVLRGSSPFSATRFPSDLQPSAPGDVVFITAHDDDDDVVDDDDDDDDVDDDVDDDNDIDDNDVVDDDVDDGDVVDDDAVDEDDDVDDNDGDDNNDIAEDDDDVDDDNDIDDNDVVDDDVDDGDVVDDDAVDEDDDVDDNDGDDDNDIDDDDNDDDVDDNDVVDDDVDDGDVVDDVYADDNDDDVDDNNDDDVDDNNDVDDDVVVDDADDNDDDDDDDDGDDDDDDADDNDVEDDVKDDDTGVPREGGGEGIES